jgi:hypothetical protein
MTAAVVVPAHFVSPPSESSIVFYGWLVFTAVLAVWSSTNPDVIPMFVVAAAWLFEFGHLHDR